MSRSAFHAKGVGAATGLKPAVSRSTMQKLGATKSVEVIDVNASPATKPPPQQTKNLPLFRSQVKKQGVNESGRPLSRVELLLSHSKAPQAVYKPVEETQRSKDINKIIKLASQWTDVRKVIGEAEELSSSNVGFALYRLGCLYSFAGNFRRAEIRDSGLVKKLLADVQQKLHQMDAGSVTLVLDGCARLEVQPEAKLLASLGNSVHTFAPSFEGSQLPLVLWAFDRLSFVPRASVLAALDSAADRLAAAMSPQGIALTLRGFQAASFSPSHRTLNRLAEAMQRQLAHFKPSEVAACVSAFRAFGYRLQPQLVSAVAQQGGQSVHSNIVTGKPSLNRSASAKSEDVAEAAGRQATLLDHGSQAAANHIAAAGRLLRSVSQRMGEMEGVLETPAAQNGRHHVNDGFKAPAAF